MTSSNATANLIGVSISFLYTGWKVSVSWPAASFRELPLTFREPLLPSLSCGDLPQGAETFPRGADTLPQAAAAFREMKKLIREPPRPSLRRGVLPQAAESLL